MKFKVNDGTNFQMNYEIIENILPTTTLFIHGNLSSNRWWYPSLEIWKKQAAESKSPKGSMILAELRGHGDSTPPQSDNEIDVITFANDFLELVKHKRLGKINIVGHSTGGIVAAIMLSKDSALFNKAILLDPIGAYGFRISPLKLQAHEMMKTDKNLTAKAIGSVIYNNDFEDKFFNTVIVEDAYKAVKNIGGLIFKNVANLNVSADMTNIKNKVLVLHGEQDVFLPIDDSKQLADLIKESIFMSVPSHGHSLNLENPKKFVNISNGFLFN